MLKVLNAGFFNSIQDKGRVGFASSGVPVSGAMDSYAADLSNIILNNSLDSAVIEFTTGGCKFQFLEKTVICMAGGNFTAKINDKIITLNTRTIVHKNDILSLGKINFGVRTYLAVKGGFLSEKKLGSRSFYQNITKYFTIKKNMIIPYSIFLGDFKTSNTSVKIDENHFNSKIITCFKGPEFFLLNKHQQEQLLTQNFSISKDNNRMGYKLEEVLENNLAQILTSSVMPGTVQLTPSGTLIVLMRDCQVTGGYPRVLQLTEASINEFAQKKSSNTFLFSLISI